MKKAGFILAPVLFLIFLAFGVLFWWNQALGPVSNSDKPIDVVIKNGASAQQIANSLQEEGIIRNAFAFKLYLQSKGLVTKIPPGEFRISPNLNVSEVVDVLLEGPIELWVTIPEGLRREEIVEKAITALELTGTDANAFRDEFLTLTISDEGYLFPETYLFPRDATATDVVSVLKNTFNTRFTDEMVASANAKGLSLEEVVILASLLERETITDEERPVVAGILLNRLNADWPLQVDASVQYALANSKCAVASASCDWWPRPLTRDDIENTTSRYNTYKYSGLPVGPISNPGISSLSAVANPEDTDYWYYIHDGDGQIHYAKTLEQHNANIAKYLK